MLIAASGKIRALMAAAPRCGRQADFLGTPVMMSSLAWALARSCAGRDRGLYARTLAAKAYRGRFRSLTCFQPRSIHASQAFSRAFFRLHRAWGGELKAVPGLADTSFFNGKRHPRGHSAHPAGACPRCSIKGAFGGSTTLSLSTSRARSRADLERVRSPVTRPILRPAAHRIRGAALPSTLAARSLYNTPPATQGLASLMIVGVCELLGIREPDGFRSRPWPGRATKRAVRLRQLHHRSQPGTSD